MLDCLILITKVTFSTTLPSLVNEIILSENHSRGLASVMSMDDGLTIGERGALDKFKGYETNKVNLTIFLRES
jgi:hypothetical protein